MNDIVICNPLRTPIGRFKGAYRDLPAADLASQAIRALITRSGLDPALVDDVILGQCYPSGEAPAIGRVAALDAGLPVTVAGIQVDRRCGSGLMALIYAAMQVGSGAADIVIAGGVESMSQVEFYSTRRRWDDDLAAGLADRLVRARVTAGGRDYPVPGGMLETAENVRERYGITRLQQDELALASQQRAAAAAREGRFTDELIPVLTGDGVKVTADEGIRANASLEKMSALPPVMEASVQGATVTAGNASTQNDAASVAIVTSSARAAELGLDPMLRLAGWAVAGVEPKLMGLGPVPATARVLGRLGLAMCDLDLIEVNEAFAAQVLGCTREWGFTDTDYERLNVNGSGISLGHPVGATGARIMTTLAYELRRRSGRYGLETMCIGGGQGLAAVFETAA